MPDSTSDNAGPPDPSADLRARAETLEHELAELRTKADARLVLAELKAEAVRAGMVDLDGLRLFDLASVRLNEAGEIDGAAQIMTQFKKAKPWLFAAAFSSSPATAPVAQPPRQKLATEMTDSEYKVARANLLKMRP
jgi:hypothetical protein